MQELRDIRVTFSPPGPLAASDWPGRTLDRPRAIETPSVCLRRGALQRVRCTCCGTWQNAGVKLTPVNTVPVPKHVGRIRRAATRTPADGVGLIAAGQGCAPPSCDERRMNVDPALPRGLTWAGRAKAVIFDVSPRYHASMGARQLLTATLIVVRYQLQTRMIQRVISPKRATTTGNCRAMSVRLPRWQMQ
jgi:hypothetical protein